jgi:hypothetical protein
METNMFRKSKFTLVAALVLGSASAALAQSGEELQNSAYLKNPNAPIPLYAQSAQQPTLLIEGRNVAVQAAPVAGQAGQDRFKSYGGY